MNILITNLHSAKNLGDDAIMVATLDGLRQIYPGARITAAANDPESWRKFRELSVVPSLCSWFGDCRLGAYRSKIYLWPFYLLLLAFSIVIYRIFRYRFLFGSSEKRRLLSSYYDSDLVLSCGGGNFYANKRVSPSLIFGLMAIALPIGLGKKVIMLPQSIGPITGNSQRCFSKWVFKRVDMIMVRENRSYDFLENVLSIDKNILLLKDLAFCLPVSFPESSNWESLEVGITIMNRAAQKSNFSNQDAYEKAIIEVSSKLHREYGASITLFSQCSGPSPDQDDRTIVQKIYKEFHQRGVPVNIRTDFANALDLRQAYQSMDLLIATRMHTAILAFGVGTPVVLIGYQPKSCGMMEDLDLGEFCIEIDQIDTELLYSIVKKALEQRKELQNKILDQYQVTLPGAQSWVEHLRS